MSPTARLCLLKSTVHAASLSIGTPVSPASLLAGPPSLSTLLSTPLSGSSGPALGKSWLLQIPPIRCYTRTSITDFCFLGTRTHRQGVLAVNDRGSGGFSQLLDESHVRLPRSSGLVGHAQSAHGGNSGRAAPAEGSSAARPRDHVRQQRHRGSGGEMCVRMCVLAYARCASVQEVLASV